MYCLALLSLLLVAEGFDLATLLIDADALTLQGHEPSSIPCKLQQTASFQKLVAVRQDIPGSTFALYYQDCRDAGCTLQVNAFTVVKRFQGSAVTSNNVLLKTDRRYFEFEGLSTSVPSFNNGYVIR